MATRCCRHLLLKELLPNLVIANYPTLIMESMQCNDIMNLKTGPHMQT